MDDTEAVKQAKARMLIQQLVAGSEPTVLLWQVLAETVHQLRRWQVQGELTEAEFDQHVRTLQTLFPLVAPTLGVLDHALDLGKRYSLAYWDSMIVGACKEAGCTTLHTEDMGSPRIIDNIQLVNPLI